MRSLFDLTAKTAVVTGGAGLLGKAIAQGLAAHGAVVYVADLDIKRAKAICTRAEKGTDNTSLSVPFSSRLLPIFLDITKPSSIRSCLRKVLASSGRIDIWVNSAYPRTKDWGNVFEKIRPASWRKNIESHLNGYFFCCQAAAEKMKKQKSGSLINMASIYGIQGPDFSIYGNTQMTMPAAYSVIKGGLVNFTRYLASYYGKYGVRVNAVSPGGVADGQPDSFIKKYSRKTPLGRMATPRDVVGAILYLASDASAYVTGHNLVVDGGFTVS